MSHATDSLETAIGDALFLGQPFPAISQWTVHLFLSLPDDRGAGGLEVPTGNTGYQPVRHDPGPARWLRQDVQDDGQTVYRNAVPVAFPTALANWGQINGFGLKDQNGHPRYVAPLAAAKTVNAGDVPLFLAGELAFTLG